MASLGEMTADAADALDPTWRQRADPDEPDTGEVVPHYLTFASILNFLGKTYSTRWDEALRHSRDNALAMRRDAFIRALLQERALPTSRRKWQLEVDNPADPAQDQVRVGLTKALQAIKFSRILRYYLTEGAIWYGRYGSQIVWGQQQIGGEPLWTVTRHTPVNGDKIQGCWDDTPAVLINTSAASRYPAECVIQTDLFPALKLARPEWRSQFIIHRHTVDDADYFEGELAGKVQGTGIRDWTYWNWWLRDELLSWAIDYLKKVGTLGLLVFWFQEGSKGGKAAAEAAAKSASKDTVLVLPRPPGGDGRETWGVEQFTTATSGIDALQRMIADYFESRIERLVVGQSMSKGADKGDGLGGTGRAEFAQDTKYQLLAFDAENVDETLTADLVEPCKRLNYPWADFPVRWKSVVPDPEADKKMEAGAKLVSAGVRIKADELREAGGFSTPDPTDETVGGLPAMPGGAVPPPAPGQPVLGQPGADQPTPEPQPAPESTPAADPGVSVDDLFPNLSTYAGPPDEPRDEYGKWTFGTAGRGHPHAGTPDRASKFKSLASRLSERIQADDRSGDLADLLRAGPPSGLDVAAFEADMLGVVARHQQSVGVPPLIGDVYAALGKKYDLSKHDFHRALVAVAGKYGEPRRMLKGSNIGLLTQQDRGSDPDLLIPTSRGLVDAVRLPAGVTPERAAGYGDPNLNTPHVGDRPDHRKGGGKTGSPRLATPEQAQRYRQMKAAGADELALSLARAIARKTGAAEKDVLEELDDNQHYAGPPGEPRDDAGKWTDDPAVHAERLKELLRRAKHPKALTAADTEAEVVRLAKLKLADLRAALKEAGVDPLPASDSKVQLLERVRRRLNAARELIEKEGWEYGTFTPRPPEPPQRYHFDPDQSRGQPGNAGEFGPGGGHPTPAASPGGGSAQTPGLPDGLSDPAAVASNWGRVKEAFGAVGGYAREWTYRYYRALSALGQDMEAEVLPTADDWAQAFAAKHVDPLVPLGLSCKDAAILLRAAMSSLVRRVVGSAQVAPTLSQADGYYADEQPPAVDERVQAVRELLAGVYAPVLGIPEAELPGFDEVLSILDARAGQQQYAAQGEAGRWVTVGGTPGEDGKRHGGHPVFIRGGKVEHGHPKVKPEPKPKQTPAVPARWKEEAEGEGIDAGDLHHLATELRRHHDEFTADRRDMLRRARELSERLGYGSLQGMAARNARGALDSAGVKGLDDVAERVASDYPHLFPQNADKGDRLYDLLVEGADPKPLSRDAAYRQALEILAESKHNHRPGGKHDDRNPLGDDDTVPFALYAATEAWRTERRLPKGTPEGGEWTKDHAATARRVKGLLPSDAEVGRAAVRGENTLEARKLENQLHYRWEQVLHAVLGSGWEHVGRSAAADVTGSIVHKAGTAHPVILDGKLVTSADQRVDVSQSGRRGKLAEMAADPDTLVALVALNLSPAASDADKGVYLSFGAGGFKATEGEGVTRLLTYQEYRGLDTVEGVRLLRRRLLHALQTVDLQGYQHMTTDQAKAGIEADARNVATSIDSAVKLGVKPAEAVETLLSHLSPEYRKELAKALKG